MESRLSKLIVSVSAVALMAAGAMAQSGTEIDFGDTTEAYAGDGLCADPRFEGTGMADDLAKAGRLSDAEDCSALYEAGEIQLEGTAAEAEAEDTAEIAEAEAEIEAAADAGEADREDAVDAESAEAETEETAEPAEEDALAEGIELAVEAASAPEPAEEETVDEGDDTEAVEATPDAETAPAEMSEPEDSEIVEEAAPDADVEAEAEAEDGAPAEEAEADAGEPISPEDEAAGEPDAELQTDDADTLSEEDDASETEAETVTNDMVEEADASEAGADTADAPTGLEAIEFGDDESEFALDGECDDARFVGDAMTNTDLFTRDIGHDATDCRAGMEDGSLRLRDDEDPSFDDAVTDLEHEEEIEPVAEPTGIMFNGVNFGDDDSKWSNDGECDDPRFKGEGMTTTRLLPEDAMHDASDCLAAWKTGELMLVRD